MADDNTYWNAVKSRVKDLAGITSVEQSASKRKAALDAAEAAANPPAPPQPPKPKSDNPAGIQFKKGGIVMDKSNKTPAGDKPLTDLGKGQKVPPTGFPTTSNKVPSSGGYKAGGMVRRGYGKARGA